jgi:hypothetical protein
MMKSSERVAIYAKAAAKCDKWHERMIASIDDVLAHFLAGVIRYLPDGWKVEIDQNRNPLAGEGSDGYWGCLNARDGERSISVFLGPEKLRISTFAKSDKLDEVRRYEFDNAYTAELVFIDFVKGKEIDTKYLIGEEE